MPKRKKKPLDEKSLLYKLCHFLYEKRVKTKGTRTPVKITVGEFVTKLGQFAQVSGDKEKWGKIVKELKNLLQYEENQAGEKLIVINGGLATLNKIRVTETSKKLVFLYKRRDLEDYLKDLKNGDYAKRGLLGMDSNIKKPTKKFKIIDEMLVFQTDSISIEKGQKEITKLFLDNAKIFQISKPSKIKMGNELTLSELKVAEYKDEQSVRDSGIKPLRKKLKKWSKEIIEIKNHRGTKKYQMVINYL